MARKISMQHIADRLGVSKYTVSQALAGKPGVSEATRREVTALAEALGYDLRASGRKGRQPQVLPEARRMPQMPSMQGMQPLPKKRSMAEMRSLPGPEHAPELQRLQNTQSPPFEGRIPPPEDGPLLFIGLDERHAKEPNFWKRVVEGLEAGCRLQGLTPSFFTFGQSAHAFDELPELLGASGAERRALGFIIAGSCPIGTLLQLARFGLPMVLADHEAPLTGADAVLNANAEAGRMACHHLLSQGCAALAFVGRDSFAVSFRERWWGCRLALDEAKETRRAPARAAYVPDAAGATGSSADPGGELLPQLKKWTIPYGGAQWRTWQAVLERRLDAAAAEGSLPEGFVCANDDIALCLLQLLAEKGLGRRGIRVVGIDNTAPGMEASVPLTTVDLAKERLGIRAVEAFVRKLKQPGSQSEKIILSARLVVRNSG
ncbi:LacI family DNA-binding transcriptional regulator [Paenibacillus glycinis]|uniref:Substrate-binding domain-containing protein n=1 Tax=Paenibacillus glycinis TaxID=2697035 RepID=A0ABW9XK32_9BACL|nr:LacI family DNA-binding transcriptional regulator [Paenibacillus glycinis]NBD22923.1 substrate-binding domain-containing protein [Paenibacillus glycinis]